MYQGMYIETIYHTIQKYKLVLEKLSFIMFVCLFHQKHLVPREEVISQSVNAGMEPDTVQLLEVDKNILLVVERITRDLISR